MSRALQVCKIREIGEALISAGVVTLDEQAEVLGLCRSTTWSLLQASHKNSGLSASVVKVILKSPRLPPGVRTKVLEYVDEKVSGRYGHHARQIARFAERLELPASTLRPRSIDRRLQAPTTHAFAFSRQVPVSRLPKAS